MKILTETKRIEVKFPSENKYLVELDLITSKFSLSWEFKDVPDNILWLRTHASELAQIATLIKGDINQVKGYEFNEDVEAKKEPSEEEKLKSIYFGFYDQMDEPEKSKAKANWDYGGTKRISVPDSIKDAVFNGFNWRTSPQGPMYWMNIKKKYSN